MATYYVAEGGTATDQAKENATSGTYPGGCLSPAGHNAETFAAGDSILFSDEGGDIRGEITAPSSGSSGSPITYGVKSGDSPVLKASDLITGWTTYDGDIWQATVTTEPEQVWVDGTYGDRKDDLGGSTDDWDKNSSYGTSEADGLIFCTNTTSDCNVSSYSYPGLLLVDSLTDAGNGVSIDTNADCKIVADWTAETGKKMEVRVRVGAEWWNDSVVLKCETGYAAEINVIEGGSWESGSSGSTTITNGKNYTVEFICDGSSLSASLYETGVGGSNLINNFDWFWESNTLYLYDSAGDPDSRSTPGVEAGQRGSAFVASGKSYLTISDITTKHGNGRSIHLTNCSNVVVDSVTSEWSFLDGILVDCSADYSDVTIQDGVFRYNGVQGIACTCAASSSTISDILVTRNQCYENGVYQGDWENDHGFTGGIKFWANQDGNDCNNIVVEQNEVYSNGDGTNAGLGIWFDYVYNDGSSPNYIRHNLVYDNYGTGIGLEVSSGSRVYANVGWNNGLQGGSGDWTPASISITSRQESTLKAANDNLIYNNTFDGAPYGVQVNVTTTGAGVDVSDNIVKNNIFTGWSVQALRATYGGANDATYGSGNVYEQNCWGVASSNFMGWGGSDYSTYDAWLTASSQADNNVEADPSFTNAGADDYTLASDSPCIGAGVDLGASYDDALMPSSTWPDGVVTGDQDDY